MQFIMCKINWNIKLISIIVDKLFINYMWTVWDTKNSKSIGTKLEVKSKLISAF